MGRNLELSLREVPRRTLHKQTDRHVPSFYIKSLGRGLIIGEPTGGSTGMPLMINLSGNLKARICTKRDMMGNGDDFVGKGVYPNIMIAPTVSDIRNGVDSQIDAALKELKRMVHN